MNQKFLALTNTFYAVPWKSIPSWLVNNRLRILMYHSISENTADPHAISPSEFKRQMRSLQTGRVISLEESLDVLKSKETLQKVFVITFDDGLLDFFTTALPILKEFRYPVTVFVPTGLVGTSSIWDSYDKTKSLMTWQQLEECQRWNVSFSSHTINHAQLTSCTDETLIEELKASLQTLKTRLDRVFPALSYPGGYQDARIRQAALEAGYCCAVGTSSRWGNGPETDFFQLRRQRFNE
jgi:peptidoglycan/xylan/chitin deacetylase (PgdA/CDA1 family)